MTPNTVFEVASNGKVVAACIAMHWVDQGKLSLDKPLNSCLAEPWLPSSPYGDQITPRHVFSHSSGLGHSTTSRENRFAPGLEYSYSAVGYLCLQAVIEEHAGQTLQALARQTIFGPLGMSSSGFINRADLTPRTSSGHMRSLVPVAAITAVFVGRGRDADRPAPPAQIRTGATKAYGSYLGWLASKRTWGKG